jgi:FAD/FMN-containing dehydrogenase/Fe-S oxidoreductase
VLVSSISQQAFSELKAKLKGDLFFDDSEAHQLQKRIYSTDASVYQEMPIAVAIPKDEDDIQLLISFASTHQVTLIPRAAGTSLAGQVVGKGIVVDISKHFTKVIELNTKEQWVRVQPGVVRDVLNAVMKPDGLMFGPETSTANRAMIGGMIGNNASGLHSIVWGDTRSTLLEVTGFLSNGEKVTFTALDELKFIEKTKSDTLEGKIYQALHRLMQDPASVNVIKCGYPKPSLTRRNTGYALDYLLPNAHNANGINLSHLIAGSEGTLMFITEAKLKLMPLPPAKDALLCVHFNSIAESLKANLIILKHKPTASELVDKYIMDFTKGHPVYQHNRFFIEGDPEAVLMVEFFAVNQSELDEKTTALIADLKSAGLGYAFPVLYGSDTKLAWDVRKAGLGLIRNLPGDHQPVNLIEDCAVSPEDLPAYIDDLQQLLAQYKLKASYYAHAGAGELHVEPLINLKTTEGRKIFRNLLKDTAALVNKHQGSLSGEHGDGRLRGEFIKDVLGSEVYNLLKEVKDLFDPLHVFNAHKIVDTPPMNEFLRYDADQQVKPIRTTFDFSKTDGILGLAEKCSGCGECRKTPVTGGVMCPSYMASRNEKDTTRARANTLRQFLTHPQSENPFNQQEIKEVMDLCLSCKGCKAECPTNVDITKMKAEFLQHYYDANGVPFRTKIIANFTKSQSLAILFPSLYNALISNSITGKLIKKIIGFAPKRSLPTVGKTSLRTWFKHRENKRNLAPIKKTVYLFCDEFSNYNDVEIGKTTVQLLEHLGYQVKFTQHDESGRTYLSKGLVRKAQQIAKKNVQLLSGVISTNTPLLGIEPSALLTFRDEYLDLVDRELLPQAELLAKNTFLVDEFIWAEYEKGNITSDNFTQEKRLVKLLGHCYQKALNAIKPTEKILTIPINYSLESIPAGCCGMAGSFGYEAEHYDLSMQVGELVLLPEIRKTNTDVLLAAPGTSCRHQIKDGASRKAKHPVEILWDALLIKH